MALLGITDCTGPGGTPTCQIVKRWCARRRGATRAPNLPGTEGNWYATTNQEYDAVVRGTTTYTERLQREEWPSIGGRRG